MKVHSLIRALGLGLLVAGELHASDVIPSSDTTEVIRIEQVQARSSKTTDPFKAAPFPIVRTDPQEESLQQDPEAAPDPFGTHNEKSVDAGAAEEGCGPGTSLGRAELRKPEMAAALCEGRFSDLDEEWLFILYYVSGFNEFLEDRGAFMDPTGACSRAVEPRQSLDLIYQAIDFVLRRGKDLERDARLEKMLEPFFEDFRKVPFILMELRVWKREGRLDATSVASRGMCGDPKFKLFWGKAIEYAKRVPGTTQ